MIPLGYLWLDQQITMDPTMIHLITGLSMQDLTLNIFTQGRLQITPWHSALRRLKVKSKMESEATRYPLSRMA
jgi:hypothetical protein